MHALRLICIAVLFASVLGCRSQPAQVVLNEGDRFPDFSLKGPDGGVWTLSDYKGSVVLVNFWATWCPPCREEMPSLENLRRRMEGNPGFRMVTVLYRDDPGRAREYLEGLGMKVPVLLDPDLSVASRFGVTGVPETYVMDKKGILRRKAIGPAEFDVPEAFEFFETLIRE